MYINFHCYTKNNLRLGDVELLTALKQNSAGQNEKFLENNLNDDYIQRYEENGWLKTVKANKKDSIFKALRTTEKANKLLVDLSYAMEYDDQDELLVNWVISTYKSRNGSVKSRKECLRRFSWFKKITAIEGNELANLVLCFIEDVFVAENPNNFKQEFEDFKKQNPRAHLSILVDNICFKPESAYDKHPTLDKSLLWQYYEENKEYVDQRYSKHLEKIK